VLTKALQARALIMPIGTATQLHGYNTALRSYEIVSIHCERGKSGLWQRRELALVGFRSAPEIQPVENAKTINIRGRHP
jgi:hypothetical protein